ncbi:MAG: hypothetical protein HPY76_12255 [Anaerolineae bacterium]|nr:hypothetical protein [Anaerolineae bacterium]
MSDLFDRVTGAQDIFKKILSKVPGFSGYIERSNRRAADKLLRGVIADRYEEVWNYISRIQSDLVNQGAIEFVDDLESAAIKLRQFIDRVRTATYGYSSLFEAVKINEAELAQLYQYDLDLLNMVDEVRSAAENVEASIGSDGLKAAVRNLVSQAQAAINAFNRRSQVIMGSATDSQ